MCSVRALYLCDLGRCRLDGCSPSSNYCLIVSLVRARPSPTLQMLAATYHIWDLLQPSLQWQPFATIEHNFLVPSRANLAPRDLSSHVEGRRRGYAYLSSSGVL